MRGTATLGGDPRFRGDVHVRCPVALAGLSSYPGVRGAPWVRAIVDAYEWTATGSPLHELEPDPTPALLDGVLLLRREIKALDSQRMRDASDRGAVGGGRQHE